MSVKSIRGNVVKYKAFKLVLIFSIALGAPALAEEDYRTGDIINGPEYWAFRAYDDLVRAVGVFPKKFADSAWIKDGKFAKEMCSKKLDGVAGWRLPTIAEVEKHGPGRSWIDENRVAGVLGDIKDDGEGGKVMCVHAPYARGAAPMAATKTAPAPVKAAAKLVASPTAVLTKAPTSPPKPQPVAAPVPKTYTVEATSSFGATARTEAEARQKVEADIKRAGNNSYQKFKRSGPITCTPGIAFGGVPGPVQCSATAYYDAVSDKPMPPSTTGTPCKEPGCGIAR